MNYHVDRALISARRISLALASAGCLAPPLTVQAAGEGALQEVVVTAQKREESVQKIPLAVSALGSEELERLGVSNVGDLRSGQIPALHLRGFAGNQTVFLISLRGFTNPNGADVSTENPVPLYVDDVYYGRANGLALEMNDIDRIEVLRGPQGTLFGKNAEGGAVRLISKAPTGELGARITAEGGNYGYKKGIAHIDLPSIGGLAAKLDFIGTDNDGWQKNPAPGQENFAKTKAYGGKLSLRWKPIDAVTLDYAFDYTKLRSTEVFNQLIRTDDPYNAVAWSPTPNRVTTIPAPTYRPLDDQKFQGHRLTFEWNMTDVLTLKSISAYRKDDTLVFNTSTTASSLPSAFFFPVPAPTPYLSGSVIPYDIEHRQFSEELQLIGTTAQVQWVAGLYFMRETGSMGEQTFFGTGFNNAVLLGPAQGFFPISVGSPVALDPPFLVPGSALKTSIRNIAEGAFAQGTWRPQALNKLALTAGVRVSRDDKDATRNIGAVYAHAFDATPAEICPCSPRNVTQTKTLPMASVAYDWTDEATTYLRYSTGYQAASFSMSGQTLNPAKASTVSSIELGQKTTLLAGTMRVNLAIFHHEWKDPQQSVQTISTSTVEFFNGPKVKATGVELDTTWAPISALVINLSGTYGNFQSPQVPSPFSGGVAGFGHIVQAPKWAGSASVQYDIAKTQIGTWQLNLDASTTTSYFANPNTANAIPAYTLVNGRFGLKDISLGGSGTMDVMLWGKNLLNRDYPTFIYDAPGIVPGTSTTASPFGDPRMYGAAVNFKF